MTVLHRSVTQSSGNTIAALDTDYLVSESPQVVPDADGLYNFSARRREQPSRQAIAMRISVILFNAAGDQIAPGTLELTLRLMRVVTIGEVTYVEGSDDQAPMDAVRPSIPVMFDGVPPGDYYVAIVAQTGTAAAAFTNWNVLIDTL